MNQTIPNTVKFRVCWNILTESGEYPQHITVSASSSDEAKQIVESRIVSRNEETQYVITEVQRL